VDCSLLAGADFSLVLVDSEEPPPNIFLMSFLNI